ncbi:MAG: MotA/TolQ/ExbB proton channel family protein, partial [Planctomycetota bacterium]
MSDAFDTTREIFRSGGPVMWPLLLLSLAALTIGLERLVFWLRAHAPRRTRALAQIRIRWANADRELEPKLVNAAGPLYIACIDALARLGARGAGEAIESVRRKAERFGGTLSFIITGAPLLGILGTVLGIIKSFEALGATGEEVQLPVIAAGIAQALVTTAFGLSVALIALVPYVMLRGHAQRALGEAEALISSIE